MGKFLYLTLIMAANISLLIILLIQHHSECQGYYKLDKTITSAFMRFGKLSETTKTLKDQSVKRDNVSSYEDRNLL